MKTHPRIVYLSRNKLNGKVYVGATRKGLKERKRCHRVAAGAIRRTKFATAINEYGWKSFEWSVLAECQSDEEMLRTEARFIRDFRSLDGEFGYNQLMSQAVGLSTPDGCAVSHTISFSAEGHSEIQETATRNGRSFACEVRWRCAQMAEKSRVDAAASQVNSSASGPGALAHERELLERMGVS